MERCSWILSVLLASAALACSSSSPGTSGDDDGTGETGGAATGSGGGGGGGGAAKTGGGTGTGGSVKKDGGSGGGAGTSAVDSGTGGKNVVGDGGLALGADGKLTIWTIGDSITNNSGYRTRMCTVLTGQSYKPWFVGSLKGGGTPCNQNDNDGHSGFGIADILNGNTEQTTGAPSGTVDDWYAGIAKPQVATLMIGTNNVAWWVAADAVMADVADEAIGLVDHILGLAPDFILIVGTIPPESSNVIQAINRDRADLTVEYNAALKQKVPAHAQYGKRLFFADTNAGLTVADLYDGIHPNAAGHNKIGDTWLSVLTPLLPPAK